MAISYRLPRTRRLTRAGFVLTQPRRFLPLLAGAVAGAIVAVVLIVAYVFLAPRPESERELAQLRQTHARVEKEANESRLAARMAGARSAELERQINALNESLRQAQDELAFFRKTQDSKR